jgi:hypothetical protein
MSELATFGRSIVGKNVADRSLASDYKRQRSSQDDPLPSFNQAQVAKLLSSYHDRQIILLIQDLRSMPASTEKVGL